MKRYDYLKLLNEFVTKPYITLTEWWRVLNFNFNSIEKDIDAGVVNVSSVVDSATLTEFGFVLCDKATPITLSLPTAINNSNKSFFITNIGVGTVTIDPYSSETIQGDVTFDLYQDENIDIISDGEGWYLR